MEMYQFAHDAAACDAWLQQQQAAMRDMPVKGQSVQEAERLLRQLDRLEKGTVPWEERFAALEKLTEVRH